MGKRGGERRSKVGCVYSAQGRGRVLRARQHVCVRGCRGTCEQSLVHTDLPEPEQDQRHAGGSHQVPLRVALLARCVRGTRKPGSDSYLGLLYPTEDYKVFGYLTCTNVKLILVADALNAKEANVKRVFQGLHTAYINAVSNPFYTPYTKIDSPTFARQVDALCG